MNEDIKLSIIIPIYNGENYIQSTIHSVLNSSYQNLEILLIDDGSTDHSLELCQREADLDSRIKVYHKENEGIACTRNYGLRHASGEYIGFCDQDDEISCKMYTIMMHRIITDGSQAAICGCYRQNKNGRRVVFDNYPDTILENPRSRNKLLLPMLFKGFAIYENHEAIIYPTIWNCIISRQLIEEKNMRFRSFVSYEDDLIMLFQLLLQADKISTLSDILYYWNTNVHSEIHRSAVRHLPDLEARQQNLINYITDNLAKNNIAPKIIEQYTYVQQCRNALLQLDNLAALNDRKTIHTLKMLRACSSISYICSAHNTVPSAKGFIRNTIIIALLRRKHIVAAYFMNRLINVIRFAVEKYQITERLERRLKRTS